MPAGGGACAAVVLIAGDVKHDFVPVFACGHTEQGQEGVQEIFEIHVALVADHLQIIELNGFALGILEVYLVEEEAEQDAEHVVAEENQAGGVDQGRQREDQRADQLLEPFKTFDQLDDTQHTENSEDLDDVGHETQGEILDQELVH